MPSLLKRKLSEVFSPATVLPGDKLVVLRRAQDETDPAKRVTTVPLGLVRDALGAGLAPNRRPDLSKQARFLTDAEAGAGGGVTLEQLLTRPDFLCLGTRITVELDPAGPNTVYIVVYDGQTRAAGSPGLIVFRDGDFTANDFVPAKVARLDSPEAATRAYPSFPAGYVFNADQLVRAFVYGNTTELFFSRKAPGGAAPAPSAVGGDANWLRVGAQDVPRSATFQAITVNQYGTHPAFSNQTALNAYLLGGTTPAPAESVTITSVTPS